MFSAFEMYKYVLHEENHRQSLNFWVTQRYFTIWMLISLQETRVLLFTLILVPGLSQFSPFNMADISVVSGDVCTKLGEGPTWDAATQKLFFVDALAYSVHVLDVETGKVLRETKKVAAKFTSEEVIVVRLTA